MHGHADIVWIVKVSSIRIDTYAEWVTLRVDKAFAFDGAASRGGGKKASKIVDLPNSDGANGLSESDVI